MLKKIKIQIKRRKKNETQNFETKNGFEQNNSSSSQ